MTEQTEDKGANLIVIQRRINTACASSRDLQVTNDEELQWAALGLKACNKLIDDIRGYFNPDIKKAHELHKSLTKKRADHLKPIEAVKGLFTQHIAAYHEEQTAKRKALESKRLKEAQERELKRQKEEREAKAAENAATAEQLRSVGAHQDAAAVEATPIEVSTQPITVAPVAPPTQNPEGLQFRENWRWRLVNIDQVPREYMILDEKLLNATARSAKGRARVPGVEFYCEKKPIQK